MLRLKVPAAIAGLFGLHQPASPPPDLVRPAPVPDACAAASPSALELEIPFAFAETDLTETGRKQLAELGAWLWCHPGAPVTLAVLTESHYQRPAKERDLADGRRRTVVAYLRDRGLSEDRLTLSDDLAAPVAPGSARLRLHGRGW
jgi:hypothetical protein